MWDLNTRRSKQWNCIFNYTGRAMSEEIVFLIHPLEKLIHFESIPSAQGVHYVHIFLPSVPCPHSTMICSTWYLLKYSYCCLFWTPPRWKSSAVKGQVGWFFQEQQKEVVSWMFWVSNVSCCFFKKFIFLFNTIFIDSILLRDSIC